MHFPEEFQICIQVSYNATSHGGVRVSSNTTLTLGELRRRVHMTLKKAQHLVQDAPCPEVWLDPLGNLSGIEPQSIEDYILPAPLWN